jgi:hypothetical protein
MSKKNLQLTATTIQEIEDYSGAERIKMCSLCRTLCDISEMNSKKKFCINCSKKIEQFGKLKIFTFKSCSYFFHKIGISKIDLESLEYEQMKHGMNTNFLEYSSNNMVWYVYRDVKLNALYSKAVELFDFYKKINFANKSCIKNSMDKFRHMFIKDYDYISVQMIISDFPNYGLNFSSFLSRDRIFV